MKRFIVGVVAVCVMWCRNVYADWTPLITSNDFSGIKVDLQTAVVGVLTLMLVILGVTMVIRMITGR